MGWLARQLRLQAESLSGRLDEFWPDIRDSQWFGGQAEAWERAPYWLDGVVPLAWVLDDPPLRQKITRAIGLIIEGQHEDGWLGPRTMVTSGGAAASPSYDLWGQILATKVLAQYHDITGDPAALHALERCFRMIDRYIDTRPLFSWAQFRWFEALVGLYHLYECDPAPWQLDLAVKLQAQGFDWEAFFARWPLTAPTEKGRWNYAGHVVNNAMAVKAPALWWRLTGAPAELRAADSMIAQLDRYHGMVTGVFSGDECLAGRSPVQGTELCAVVEYLYSLEVLLAVRGEVADADRLERIAYNALPATFSPDMWSHQYDQQVNQVECSVLEGRTWNTNGPDANTFGVEPNYGCCTANLSQGWPKLAAHLWMRGADNELAAVAYAPGRVSTTIAGAPVTVTLETDYPFRQDLHFTVETAGPTRFALLLRIPAWATAARLVLPDGREVAPPSGAFYRVERDWEGLEELTLTLPAAAAWQQGHNGAVALVRGPLVYSLPLGEDWRRIHEDVPGRELPHGDWEVHPTTPWNYAVEADVDTPEAAVEFLESPVGELPFSPAGAPVSAVVSARRLPAWQLVNGSAADTPVGPVDSDEPREELTFIPYGCTNLRMTEFPPLRKNAT